MNWQEAMSIPAFHVPGFLVPHSVPRFPVPCFTDSHALIDNDTFELVPCPKGGQIVGAKWVYTIKTDQNEKETYKTRFVAKGYSPIPDIDYQETFALT